MAPSRRQNHRPVIPLQPSEAEKSVHIEYVKHLVTFNDPEEGTSETMTERIPKVNDETTIRQFLEFFTSFRHAHNTLNWVTGPKLFSKFRVHLEGIHLDVWNETIIGVAETVENFNASFDAFKSTQLAGYDYYEQLEYVRTIKKSLRISLRRNS